jgi:hypothetical protein
MKRMLVLVSASAAIGIAAFAGTASASAPTTPNGFVGACNMLNDPTMFTVAMVNANHNGFVGMFRAVDASGGDSVDCDGD